MTWLKECNAFGALSSVGTKMSWRSRIGINSFCRVEEARLMLLDIRRLSALFFFLESKGLMVLVDPAISGRQQVACR